MLPPGESAWPHYLEDVQKLLDIQLSGSQLMALEYMAHRKFIVLAGPSQAGKSTCMRVFDGALRKAGHTVLDLRSPDALPKIEAALQYAKSHPTGLFVYDAVLLDDRAFERADFTTGLLNELSDACRVVLVVNTEKHGVFPKVVKDLRSFGNRALVPLQEKFRQRAPERIEPVGAVVQALGARLQRKLTVSAEDIVSMTALYKKERVLTEDVAFALDVFAGSALSFIIGDAKGDTQAEEVARAYASLMSGIGRLVLDMTKTGPGTVPAQCGDVDVLLLDASSFEVQKRIEQLARVMTTLNPNCRVVVFFDEWPSEPGVTEVLEEMRALGIGRAPTLVVKERGEVRLR